MAVHAGEEAAARTLFTGLGVYVVGLTSYGINHVIQRLETFFTANPEVSVAVAACLLLSVYTLFYSHLKANEGDL